MIVKPVGIENVVNWQDNGIFADTQKPVTDDNYTLAGDVNQDNLYVGYMKEHGLKGKLSLPVLSSLGAITGRQTIGDCEVYKHVNGTTIIKGAVINPNLPDSRISLGFSADENGLQYYNNPNDPMPIKTINMAGLQKWEETDDYIIYVDKDAVMTTVQNYVTGTYDLFLERKNQIDGAMELLKENGIEWTAEDDSKLLQDINLAQLERIASMPTTMDESTEIQAFETRTVPTTYECCFRTDKKTGEIYIGEGYENLWSVFQINTKCAEASKNSNGHLNVKFVGDVSNFWIIKSEQQTTQGSYSTTCVIVSSSVPLSPSHLNLNHNSTTYNEVKNVDLIEIGKTYNILNECKVEGIFNLASFRVLSVIVQKDSVFELALQITKTSTQKPFVKSVMPNGKLSFVTDANEATHTFILKVTDLKTINFTGSEFNVNGNERLNQTLVYKGIMTSTELKAENEKVINIGAYYQQENSVPLIYGIDSMKAMRVYSPALTDTEIAEEVNKNIYIPQNRDGVPNCLGEVK